MTGVLCEARTCRRCQGVALTLVRPVVAAGPLRLFACERCEGHVFERG